MADLRYISTRGKAPALGFEDVLLAGLARDGGLYVPERWPRLGAGDLRALRGLGYATLAAHLMRPFIGRAIPESDFAGMTDAAYRSFAHPDVVPLVPLGPNEHLLELF